MRITSFVGGRVPDGRAKGERMYGDLVKDAYGEPYTWVTAEELGPVRAKHLPKHPATAYVQALDPETLIVLDWY